MFVGLMVIILSSCTDNIRAKAYGGSMTINVPKGNKVTNITWKNGDKEFITRGLDSDQTVSAIKAAEKMLNIIST